MLLDISSWWDSLNTLQAIFFLTAIPATAVLLILMFTTLVGADADADVADVDLEIEGDPGIGFQFFSLKNLTAFFTMFGWFGLYAQGQGYGTGLTLFIAMSAGLIAMAIMAFIFYLFARMQESGTLNVDNAVNKYGEVYLTIPPNRGGIGKVQIQVQGSLRELDAFSDEDTALPQGTVVKVKEVIQQHILLVERVNK